MFYTILVLNQDSFSPNIDSTSPSEEIFSLKNELKNKNEELKNKDDELKSKDDELKNHKDQIDSLRILIKKLKDLKFGSSSEKIVHSDQLSLFNEAEENLGKKEEDDEDDETEEITYTRKKKGKQKTTPLPEYLEREIVDFGLEENKICPLHNEPMEHIGHESVEKLVTKPAEHMVREERTHKYKCPCCESPFRAEKPESIIPKSLVTPELLSFIIFSKYQQALPLYRIEDYYAMYEIKGVTRSNMSRWLIDVADKLQPIMNVLSDKVFETGYVGIDETRVQVLDEKDRKAQTNSSMWAYGSSELNITLFDYNISKGSKAVKEILESGEYKGVVQTDEHSCYNYLNINDDVLRLGCMMHSRRKFYEAHKALDKKSLNTKYALKVFKKLYDFEDDYKERRLTNEERFWARVKDQTPLLTNFKEWMEDLYGTLPPKSPIAQAINYSLNHWEHLTNYLTNGRFEADNGFIERSIKHFAVGRKNWLFSQSVHGAKASSMYYSMAVTAKKNGINLYEAMTQILTKIPQAKTYEDFEALAQLLYIKPP